MANKRVRDSSDINGQPLIQTYYAKKPKDNATPSVSCERQQEILLPTRVDLATLPNPMPKTATGHSIQKMWFEDYPWLQLAKNMRSLYCGSCHWAFQNHRLGPSDMNTCSNTTFPWKNMEVGYENIKKGRDGIRKHGESLIHRNAESALNSALNLAAHRVMVNDNVKKEISVNGTALQAVFESVRFCGQQGISLRGHRNEEHTANFHCLMNLIAKFNPKVSQYLFSSEKFKFLSKDIQNEILQTMSHSLLRDLIDRVRRESNGLSKEPAFLNHY